MALKDIMKERQPLIKSMQDSATSVHSTIVKTRLQPLQMEFFEPFKLDMSLPSQENNIDLSVYRLRSQQLAAASSLVDQMTGQ